MINKYRLLLVFVLLWVGSWAQAQQITSIADAKKMAEGAQVTLKGVITTNPTFVSNTLYMQDATGGIKLYNFSSSPSAVFSDLRRGDSIQVTGVTSLYYDVWELVAGDKPLDIKVLSDHNPEPKPKDILADSLNEHNESYLVRMEKVTIQTNESVFSGGGSKGNYTLVDSLGNKGILRINSSSHPLVGKAIPKGSVTLIGVVDQFSSDYQLVPRDANDLIVGLSIDSVTTSMTNASLKFNWTTNLEATTVLRFRPVDTGEAAWDTLTVAGNSYKHSLTVPGLSPASFYEVQLFASAIKDGDKEIALTAPTIYTTVSNSSGEMQVFFNDSVDAMFNHAGIAIPHKFPQKIAEYIDKAKYTVDVAIYNANATNDISKPIFDALNAAYNRGVQVRVVIDADNNGMGQLDAHIPVERSFNTASTGIMHNKFVVIDAGSRDNSYVVDASANWTSSNIDRDQNNMVIVQDQSFAKAFQREFEEMWGSTGAFPNSNKARFGAAKTANTPTEFMIGGKRVELYFTPTDHPADAIKKALASVNSDLRFALNILTSQELTDAILNEYLKGWSVVGLMEDQQSSPSSQLTFLESYFKLKYSGVEMYLDGQYSLMHNKFAVVDALRPESDPLVITGSYNWSFNAENNNDENCIIIHDDTVALQYLSNFRRMLSDLAGASDNVLTGNANPLENAVQLYPNPATDQLHIQLPEGIKSATLTLYNLSGEVVRHQALRASIENTVDISQQNAGIYFINIKSTHQQITKKLIIK